MTSLVVHFCSAPLVCFVDALDTLVAASHDAERRGNRALARGQYRADQQPLGFPPSRAAVTVQT